MMATATLAGCSGGGATGPNDDVGVFGVYTLERANGESVPGVRILEASPGPGAAVNTDIDSGTFRISEDGTWGFSMHFVQLAIFDDQVSGTEYDVEDSGTYTMQGETITLDGGTVLLLIDGVLSRTIIYDVPGAPVTTVVYEFEK
jgi:hypothetical protein